MYDINISKTAFSLQF